MKRILTLILFLSLLLGGTVHAKDGDTLEHTEEVNLQEVQNEVITEEDIIEEIQILDDEETSEVPQQEIRTNKLGSIGTVDELLEAITNASEDLIIVLSNSFVSGNIEIPMPTVNITIDGSNIEWNNGTVKIVGESIGSIDFKNITFDGSNINDRLFKIYADQGKVIFNDVVFKNSKEGALEISKDDQVETTGVLEAEFNRVLFENNKSTNGASALYLYTHNILEKDNEKNNIPKKLSIVDINDSTFIDNEGKSNAGEVGGAFAGKDFNGTININNTVFRNNVNSSSSYKPENGVAFGGGGGAIEFNNFWGHANVNESIFDANSTNGKNGNVESSYNGGAINIYDGRGESSFKIENSTFSNNVAYNGGGAIHFQGARVVLDSHNGMLGLLTNITNSTFFKNEAYGLSETKYGQYGYAGGAIQYFKFSGSSKMTNNILSSTFVSNSSGHKDSIAQQRGGAIVLNGWGTFALAAVTRNNSLFVDNKVYNKGEIDASSNYKDISNYTTEQGIGNASKFNIINVQKGLNPKHTNGEILEHEVPFLANNGTIKYAGVDEEPIQTIMIKPGGLADNTFKNDKITVPLYDQRGFLRGKDQGALNTFYIGYDSNGGYYEPVNPNGVINDDYEYTEKNSEGKYVKQFYLGTDDTKNNIFNPCPGYIHPEFNLYPESELPIYCKGNDDENFKIVHPNGDRFIGWSMNKDAAIPDANLDFNDITTMESEFLDIYAVWLTRVNFDANGGYFGNKNDNILEAETFVKRGTILGEPIGPKRDGYSFVGWYTDKELTQEWNSSNPITNAMTLYGKWDKGYSITINYQDMWGNSLLDNEGKPIETLVEVGKENEKYTLDIKEVSNYFFDSVTIDGKVVDTKEIIFGSTGEDNIDVVIRYKKNPTLTIKYVDEDGNTLKDDITLTQSPGTTYNLKIEEIEGYVFKEINVPALDIENIIIEFGEEDQVIIISYRLDDSEGGENPEVPVEPEEPIDPGDSGDGGDTLPGTGIESNMFTSVALTTIGFLLILIGILRRKQEEV